MEELICKKPSFWSANCFCNGFKRIAFEKRGDISLKIKIETQRIWCCETNWRIGITFFSLIWFIRCEKIWICKYRKNKYKKTDFYRIFFHLLVWKLNLKIWVSFFSLLLLLLQNTHFSLYTNMIIFIK